MIVYITEDNSFIGKNLIENLKNIRDGKNRTRPNLSISDITKKISDSDVVVILPGTDINSVLQETTKQKIIFISPLTGCDEERLLPKDSLIYRLPDIIGKWQGTDNYIASLCYLIANDLDFEIKNQYESVQILFIDDFINEIFDALEGHPHRCDFPEAGEASPDPTAQYDGKTPVPKESGKYCYSPEVYHTSVGNIIRNLKAFNELNSTSLIPSIPDGSIAKKLFSMYLSYLPERKMSYPVRMSVDNRGVFTELVKTANNGQISINIARPGNVRGQHWHNTKWEIFIVVSGHGLIQERKIGSEEVINFEVRGEDMRAVIMLPGYTHNIINLEKDRDLVTVMYANEQFDSMYPDTFFEVVES